MSVPLRADGLYDLPEFRVNGRGDPIVGEAISASQGYVGRADLETRPLARTGEILETVPGLIVTQHSGSGKANQYFLRGFNLDHGTDFATWVDGMPVNMVTHAHGQGYTDLNFVIPEMVELMSYYKGAYYAPVGDFSGTGSASIRTASALPRDIAQLSIGPDGYRRGVYANSQGIGQGSLLAAIELQRDDGPWQLPEDLRKTSGMLKYTKDDGDIRSSITFMGYDSQWKATDQIPQRAVSSGLIPKDGFVDPTVGGSSSRYSLSASRLSHVSDVTNSASVYAIRYDMNLWSNFTYFLDDPVNGDQFEQADRRMVYGGSLARSLTNRELWGKTAKHSFGMQFRYDDIGEVGLYHTKARQRLGTVREDSVNELALGSFYDLELRVTPKLRLTAGLRADWYRFDVSSNIEANSGEADDAIISPKLNLIYAISEHTELYASAGYGFHSNDARGATISVDPADPSAAADPVDPLVRSLGSEVGARFHWNEKLNTSVALWTLDLDSELLYIGDAGATESSVPSSRQGIELASHYAPVDGLTFDWDVALTRGRLSASPAGEDRIPGAMETIASAGVTWQKATGLYGSARWRYFGGRPLTESNAIRSSSSDTINLRIGYRWDSWELALDILNAADSRDDDITYYYESRLPGEPAEGIADLHAHPLPPRSARLNIGIRF